MAGTAVCVVSCEVPAPPPGRFQGTVAGIAVFVVSCEVPPSGLVLVAVEQK